MNSCTNLKRLPSPQARKNNPARTPGETPQAKRRGFSDNKFAALQDEEEDPKATPTMQRRAKSCGNNYSAIYYAQIGDGITERSQVGRLQGQVRQPQFHESTETDTTPYSRTPQYETPTYTEPRDRSDSSQFSRPHETLGKAELDSGMERSAGPES